MALCASYGDHRPVQTVFNRDLSIAGLPLNVQVACRNGRWIDEQRNISVNSLSCVYEPPTTTTEVTTTYAPGDPNNPCNQCTQDLYATPEAGQEGSTYMDFRYEKCLTVLVYCQPIKPNMHVDLLENGRSVALNGATINRTFECTEDREWVDTTSQLLVENVTCLMRDGQ
ncbi:C6 domain protein [Oesophagostomum dentatum]|uniref:C6 domain protein n=1 Tax=Oesophagostomum dentatum TaxID=61180 RepID=A0A0B1TSN9_OESDE|nr:C6 domain protein [Oesophagostomum dentatum]